MLRRLLIAVIVGWPIVVRDVAPTMAEEEKPTPGKSQLVAASFLKRVEKFRRKVVFFHRDADLACLAVPDPDRRVPDFLVRVGAFAVAGADRFSAHVEMTKDGDLVFSSGHMILRVDPSGTARKLVELSELTVAGVDKPPQDLHIEQLLGSSTAANVLYVRLSNEPKHAPGVVYTQSGSCYLGKLDLASRRLSLLPCEPWSKRTSVDFDGGFVYQINDQAIEEKDFAGKILGRWSPPDTRRPLCSLFLGPDKRTMLVGRSLLSTEFSVLDLKSRRETEVPIEGQGMVLGRDQTIYYLVEKERELGVLDTSLMRFRIGEKEPTRLFLVSCQRVKMRDSLLGNPPRLSTDLSWLAWRLPVEDARESATILLDIVGGQYRIIKGYWGGVQLQSPGD